MFKRAELKVTLFDERDVIQTSDGVGDPFVPSGDDGSGNGNGDDPITDD